MREILVLYKILGKYLPKEFDDKNILAYSQKIIHNIIEDESNAFVKSLGLMSKITFNDMLRMSDVERFKLFTECIIVNRLWDLEILLRNIHYGDSR